MKCTYWPNGRHEWDFLVCTSKNDIYQCQCKMQQTVKHGEMPSGKVGRTPPPETR